MQQWEYLFVDCLRDEKPPGRVFKVGLVNGQLVDEWQKGSPAHDYANRLGAEGWELVSHVVPSNLVGTGRGFEQVEGIHLVFKRPKP